MIENFKLAREKTNIKDYIPTKLEGLTSIIGNTACGKTMFLNKYLKTKKDKKIFYINSYKENEITNLYFTSYDFGSEIDFSKQHIHTSLNITNKFDLNIDYKWLVQNITKALDSDYTIVFDCVLIDKEKFLDLIKYLAKIPLRKMNSNIIITCYSYEELNLSIKLFDNLIFMKNTHLGDNLPFLENGIAKLKDFEVGDYIYLKNKEK